MDFRLVLPGGKLGTQHHSEEQQSEGSLTLGSQHFKLRDRNTASLA